MKRLWTKNVDSITTNFINYPYVYAFLAVMLGFLAGVCFPRHDNSLVDNFLRFCLIFLAAGNCYFLARTVCRLRDGDSVSQRDDLLGMHLDQE
jgi:hypothetical protein